MKKIMPSINNFPIFLQFCDLEYEGKKPNLSKIDSLCTVGNLANYII